MVSQIVTAIFNERSERWFKFTKENPEIKKNVMLKTQDARQRMQGTERRVQSKKTEMEWRQIQQIKTDQKAPLGGFGGEKSGAIRQNL